MKKRPLCMMCLMFLIIRGILLIINSGQSIVVLPATSIFYDGESKKVQIKGQVYRKTSTGSNQILYLKNNSIYFQNKSFYESNILIYDDTFEEIPLGKTIYVAGQLNAFETARNPGNFDQRLYYAKQNIYGFLWSEKIIKVTGEENKFMEELYQLRQCWREIILQNVSKQNGGILSAILLSEKGMMESEIKELYQKNGISHILAISGLHISFIGMGIYHLIRKTGVSYVVSGSIAVGILSLYVLMIGFSVSVIRAYLMLLLRIGADLTGRVYDMLTALMLSAACVVAYQPLYLADAAFYLSYGAILGILFVTPMIEILVPYRKKWIKGVFASIATNIMVFPMILWFYYEFPIYSLLLNMIVIPFMTWVLSFGIFGSLGYIICRPVGKLLLKVCDLILNLYEILVKIGVRIPFSTLVFGKPDWWDMVIYYSTLCGILLFLKYYGKTRIVKKSRRYILIISSLVLFAFIKIPNGRLEITMLDVGQGDSIYIKGPYGKQYLIDGGSSDVASVGKYRLEPFLKSCGVGALDYVFISHGDSDHCNGIMEMIERQNLGVKIKNLVLPANCIEDAVLSEIMKSAFDNGINVLLMDAGQTMKEGKLTISCLQPEKKQKLLEENAGSMVLELSFGHFNMLCTGDVEGEGEDMLTQNVKGNAYDVLKVAHHGSKNSTKEAFLREAEPKIALISVGRNNRYGHPHKETIARLQEIGCEVYQTCELGAITFETDGDFIDFFLPSI